MDEKESPERRWSLRSLAVGVAVGAALAYVLDPERGRKRRRLLRDRSAAVVRRGGKRTARAVRVETLRAYGHARGTAHRLRSGPKETPDDATLAHKVESVLFRDPAVPKGKISINAEEGLVYLRGEVEKPDLIEDLEAAVRRIEGVRGVKNLLHLPGTPAPASHGGKLLQ